MKENMSIDSAINAAEEIARNHRRASTLILFAFVMLFTVFMMIVAYMAMYRFSGRGEILATHAKVIEKLNKLDSAKLNIGTTTSTDKTLPSSLEGTADKENSVLYYIGFAFSIVVISVLISLYKLHFNESTKAEHNQMALMRIRIAGNNFSNEGFKSEVREALTHNAFSVVKPEGLFTKKNSDNIEIKSPIPGHPTSEILTSMLNKILDSIEIKAKA